MHARINQFLLMVLVLGIGLRLYPQMAHAQTPIVRAVFFFSPSCSHCHEVINEDFPPLVEKYQGQLDIVGIDVEYEVGQNLYQAAAEQFQIPDERIGIPTLIVGDVVLVGSDEIPEKFPGIVEQGLAEGGIDWPEIPGLQEVLAAQVSSSNQQNTNIEQTSTVSSTSSFTDKFSLDPVGNSIAVIVLFGMLASVLGVGYAFVRDSESRFLHWPQWVLPGLALIGLGVALYMSYIEATHSEAVCGPVGDCNSVQESPYALLFGVIPVGLMGAVGYAAILVAWLIEKLGPQTWQKISTLAIWGMAWFGVLFSIYLTFLEPFVIGATCAWCITSAIVMALILWASTKPALDALKADGEYDDNESISDNEALSSDRQIL